MHSPKKNKSSLKTIVLLSVSRLDASDFEKFINTNKDTYLAKYVNKNNYTRFKSGPFMMTVQASICFKRCNDNDLKY